MKRYAREGDVVIAGYVGGVNEKTENLVSVSIANRLSKDETEFVHVAFTNPREGVKAPNLADLARNYVEKGQYITVLAREVENGDYKNYYANSVELGPRSRKN